MVQPFTTVSGEVPRAPREGRILGTAVCEAGHTVLVVGNHSGRAIIEAHLDDEEVEQVVALLRAARNSTKHPSRQARLVQPPGTG